MQGQELVCGNFTQNGGGAVRPADLNFVHLRGLPQPEVQARVVAAEVAVAATHVAQLPL